MKTNHISLKDQRAFGRVARLLDDAQSKGQLVVTLSGLATEGHLTPMAVQRQLDHVKERFLRLPVRPSAYLLVAPEHRARGAPPVAAWLDADFRAREEPYYLGLLSAAALYESSQQAAQVTQVMVTRPMRPFEMGRLRVEFFVKTDLSKTPLRSIQGLPAPLAVSSPEATALDLVAFNSRIGGISRVAEVLAGMTGTLRPAGLRSALAAESRVAVKQRLGYLLDRLGMTRLASIVELGLPRKLAPVLLQQEGTRSVPAGTILGRWKVLDNVGISENLQ